VCSSDLSQNLMLGRINNEERSQESRRKEESCSEEEEVACGVPDRTQI